MRYLNGVLTVIAFCLVIITASLLHLFPEAKAGDINYQTKPTPVNIVQIDGISFPYSTATDNAGKRIQPSIPVSQPGRNR